jgi:hypothetical protein
MGTDSDIVERYARAQLLMDRCNDNIADTSVADIRLIRDEDEEIPLVAQPLRRRWHAGQQSKISGRLRRERLSISDMHAVENSVAVDEDSGAARRLHHFVALR